ncbi:MAG: hypothetical protein P8R54_24860 [Myxococcota bacterium]|nr:hypothetical protein [Myxococcota bacterium]
MNEKKQEQLVVKMVEKKRASEGPRHGEASATVSGSGGALSSAPTSPTGHDRTDAGCPDYGILSFHAAPPVEGPPAAVTPEHTGPRYACEKCGALGDDDRSCVRCGHWELLDLHRASDRQFSAILITQRIQRRRHLITGGGLISALAGVVLLLIGTVYVASPVLLIGLILTLGGATLAAGGPINV